MPARISSGERQTPSQQFRGSFSLLWKDEVGGLALRLLLLQLTFLVVLLAVFAWRLPPEIPLMYSRPWGLAQLVPSSFLFFVVAGVALLVGFNSYLSSVYFETEPLLARIVSWAGVLTVFLIDITVTRVFLLVL